MSPLRIFRIATIFAKIEKSYAGRNVKGISSSLIFPNFLPLDCEEIFLLHVTLRSNLQKEMDVYDVTIV